MAWVLAVAAVAVGAVTLSAGSGAGAATATKPNIVVITTDDQTVEEMKVLPNIQRLVGQDGTTFENSFVSYSLCCPSRATFLTGQYAHNHGVLGNNAPEGGYYKLNSSNTLPLWLQRAGYRTALVGKYLNDYGTRNPTEIPPGWTEWQGLVDPSTYNYFGYKLNDNGTLYTDGKTAPPAYQTDFLAGRAEDVIRRFAGGSQPFFLWFTPLAPHEGGPRDPGDPPNALMGPSPSPKYRGHFANEPLPQPPNFNVGDQGRKPLTSQDIALIQSEYRQELETLLSVDDAVSGIFDTLQKAGVLGNTVVIFTSDNGFMHGEHRVMFGKVVPYEPSIRVPLMMRGPGVPKGLHLSQMVANLDLAPTIEALAHAKPGLPQDGRSLLPLLHDRGLAWGRALLIEANPKDFVGIRTPLFKYVEFASGPKEFQDLGKDPYETKNLAGTPAYASIQAGLAQRLAKLRSCVGAACIRGPSVSLTVSYRRGPGRCARSPVRAAVGGPDAQLVTGIQVFAGARKVAVGAKAPFTGVVPRTALRGTTRIRAYVSFLDGTVMSLDKRIRVCR